MTLTAKIAALIVLVGASVYGYQSLFEPANSCSACNAKLADSEACKCGLDCQCEECDCSEGTCTDCKCTACDCSDCQCDTCDCGSKADPDCECDDCNCAICDCDTCDCDGQADADCDCEDCDCCPGCQNIADSSEVKTTTVSTEDVKCECGETCKAPAPLETT